MDTVVTETKYLFGGDSPWPTDDGSKSSRQCTSFRAIDDRVRGGSSVSHLLVSPSGTTATFRGELDTSTLGGAGFASQCTVDGPTWDLARYDGLQVDVAAKADAEAGLGKTQRYVLLVKDALEGKRPDGRMESGVSWEWTFEAKEGDGRLFAKWEEFKPTYRGREIDVPDGSLKTGEIKRVGLMMRSFFDAQSGSFALPIHSIAAVKLSSSASSAAANTTTTSPLSPSSTATSTPSKPAFTDEQLKAQKKAEKKAEKARREQERDQRTGIGALTGEMRDRGEGGGWRGWFNFIGRGCF